MFRQMALESLHLWFLSGTKNCEKEKSAVSTMEEQLLRGEMSGERERRKR